MHYKDYFTILQDEDETKTRAQILWELYFNCPETSECDLSANVPKNVYLTSGPDLDIDFEFAVKQVRLEKGIKWYRVICMDDCHISMLSFLQAKEIFFKMYPNEEFLPRAPDPEELVLDDGDDESKPDEGSGDSAAAKSAE